MYKHTLSTLTKLCPNKIKFKWTEEGQNSFMETKKILGIDVILLYPNSSEEFIIHTDARKSQLRGLLSQNGKPIAFFYS